jgi:hypothetical protein
MMMPQVDILHERVPQPPAKLAMREARYYVELPLAVLDEQGSLLDSVIRFTFDTLNIQHLDLRIVAEGH